MKRGFLGDNKSIEAAMAAAEASVRFGAKPVKGSDKKSSRAQDCSPTHKSKRTKKTACVTSAGLGDGDRNAQPTWVSTRMMRRLTGGGDMFALQGCPTGGCSCFSIVSTRAGEGGEARDVTGKSNNNKNKNTGESFACGRCGRSQLEHRLVLRGGASAFMLLRAARQVLFATGPAGYTWVYAILLGLGSALDEQKGIEASLRVALWDRTQQATALVRDAIVDLAEGADAQQGGAGGAGVVRGRPDVLALCELDTIFFHMHYCDLNKNALGLTAIPDFFEKCNAVAARYDQELSATSSPPKSSSPSSSSSSSPAPTSMSISAFVRLVDHLEPGGASVAQRELGRFFCPETMAAATDDLTKYWRARVREGVRLFGSEQRLLIAAQEMDKVAVGVLESAAKGVGNGVAGGKKGKGKKRSKKGKKEKRREGASGTGRPPPPCYDALNAWRDDARDWACTFYAFAVPSAEAIDRLCDVALRGVIEIGAGTGYWASLVRQRGGNIVAFDKDLGKNEYHGDAPRWTKVERGGIEVLHRPEHHNRCLFLCYPPPDTDMALRCLRVHRGEYVAHVGELAGDTGTPAFETMLWQEYRLISTIALPNFTNTQYALSIWRRRSQEPTAPASSHLTDVPAGLAVCANPTCNITSGLYRCRYCRHAASFCCSPACCLSALPMHHAVHLVQLAPFADPKKHLSFDKAYEELRVGPQFAVRSSK